MNYRNINESLNRICANIQFAFCLSKFCKNNAAQFSKNKQLVI